MKTNDKKGIGLACAFALGLGLWASGASAQQAQAGAQADVGASGAPSGGGKSSTTSNEGAFVIGGKIGGIVPFGKMNPFVYGALELGYIFGGTERRIGALLDVSYTVPHKDGTASDARIIGGSYSWELTQKELVFQPTFLYRITGVAGDLVPFVGIGPRIYLLETVVEGKAGDAKIMETKEHSTKFGVGLPLGIEYELGPGGLLAELLFQYGPLNHTITGSTNLGGATLQIGYRALL